jgi:hypothetical protein
MIEPASEKESRVFRKVAVVEDGREFGTFEAETLQRGRRAGGEIPQIALLEVIDVPTAFEIEGCDRTLPSGAYADLDS